jgi:hypothetical protein
MVVYAYNPSHLEDRGRRITSSSSAQAKDKRDAGSKRKRAGK